MAERTKPFLYISKLWYSIVFAYYLVLFGVTGSILFFELLPQPPSIFVADIMTRTLFGSLAGAMAFSSLYYIRKLYKDSLQDKLDAPRTRVDWFKSSGTVLYYIGRPLFAALFSMVVYVGSKLSIYLVTAPGTVISDGYFYVNVIASCYVGAATGRLVAQIEHRALQEIAKVG